MITHLSKVTKRWIGSIGVILAIALGVTGCHWGGHNKGGEATPNPVMGTPEATSHATYRAGDTLSITYSDTPNPIQPMPDVRVREDGTITLLYNKEFVAAGKTRGQLEREIRDFYVPTYFRNLTVRITPEGEFYFVNGEVKAPNRFVWAGNMTVTAAVASAGGFTDFANRHKVRLIRGNKIVRIDCAKALQDPSLDKEVLPGDRIEVPRRVW